MVWGKNWENGRVVYASGRGVYESGRGLTFGKMLVVIQSGRGSKLVHVGGQKLRRMVDG